MHRSLAFILEQVCIIDETSVTKSVTLTNCFMVLIALHSSTLSLK